MSISPLAAIHPSVKLPESCSIAPFTVIARGATIGENCTIGHNVFIGNDVAVGDNVSIQGNCFIPSGVSIGDNVFIGPGVTFCNVKRPPLPDDEKGEYEKTLIGSGCVIGAGCTILPGITMHPFSKVGAGAVLTHDSMPGADGLNVWYIGNPAKPKTLL